MEDLLMTPEQLWANHTREQRITNRVKQLYDDFRRETGTTVDQICRDLDCSTTCLYNHLNAKTPRQPRRMAILVNYLGGDPATILEDENARQHLDSANEPRAFATPVDRALHELTEAQICELMIAAAPRIEPGNLACVVRELMDVGWTKASRPLEIPF